MKNYKILAINPGSTTTKLAYYADGEIKQRLEVFHPTEQLGEIMDQLTMRTEMVAQFLKENDIKVEELDMIVARGARLPGISTGAYEVNEAMVGYLPTHTGNHASTLACMIGKNLGDPYGVKCMIYDSVSADDYMPEAKTTGVPECEHLMVCHVLNSRMVAHKAAEEMGKKYEDCNFIVVHLGGGSSVSAHKHGRIMDCISNDRGPMSPERSGGLSTTPLAELCYSGKYTKSEMMKLLMGKGGMVQLLGTQDMRAIEDMFNAGDEKAVAAVNAMAYQHARTIAGMMAPLEGQVDKVIYTGGLCRFKGFVEIIKSYLPWLTSVEYPGEFEMEGLIQGTIRVLEGEEPLKPFSL